MLSTVRYFQVKRLPSKTGRLLVGDDGVVRKEACQERIFARLGVGEGINTHTVQVGGVEKRVEFFRAWVPFTPKQATKMDNYQDVVMFFMDNEDDVIALEDLQGIDLTTGKPYGYDSEAAIATAFGSGGGSGGASSGSGKIRESCTLPSWDGKKESWRGWLVSFTAYLGKCNKRHYVEPEDEDDTLDSSANRDFWDTLVLSFRGGDAFESLLNLTHGNGTAAFDKFKEENTPGSRLCFVSDAVQEVSTKGLTKSLSSEKDFNDYLNRKNRLTQIIMSSNLCWISHGNMCKVFCLGPDFTPVFQHNDLDLTDSESVDRALKRHREFLLKGNKFSEGDKALATQLSDLQKRFDKQDKKHKEQLSLLTRDRDGAGSSRDSAPKDWKDRDKVKGHCFRCGVKGHLSANCKGSAEKKKYYKDLLAKAKKDAKVYGAIGTDDWKTKGGGGKSRSSGDSTQLAAMGLTTADDSEEE